MSLFSLSHSNNISQKMAKYVNLLHQYSRKSDMTQKHAAMIISGGKLKSIGFNHDRMTSANKFILSFHAEIHALTKYIENNNISHLRSYINDTNKCISFRKEKSPSDL